MNRKRQAVGAAAVVALLRTRVGRQALERVRLTLRLPGNWPEIPDKPPKPQDREQRRTEPEEPPKAVL